MLTNITSLSVVVNETNLKQQNAAPGFFFKNYAPHCPYLACNAQSHFLALLLQKVSKIHINLFSVATSVVIISPCYKFSRQYTTAASFIFGLARPI